MAHLPCDTFLCNVLVCFFLLVLRLLDIEQFLWTVWETLVIPNKSLLCFMLVLGRTPLYYAIQGDGSQAVVECLIKKGADPNKAANRGVTPLHCAARKGFLCRCICLFWSFTCFVELCSRFILVNMYCFHTVGSFLIYFFFHMVSMCLNYSSTDAHVLNYFLSTRHTSKVKQYSRWHMAKEKAQFPFSCLIASTWHHLLYSNYPRTYTSTQNLLLCFTVLNLTLDYRSIKMPKRSILKILSSSWWLIFR